MKIMLDLDILLDVFQNRQPHYSASSQVLNEILSGEDTGIVPGHGVTTAYYIIQKRSSADQANQAVDWLLKDFEIAACDRAVFRRARSLPMKDFEDAVVVALAERERCAVIVTRNTTDFKSSPIQAMTPEEFLRIFETE